MEATIKNLIQVECKKHIKRYNKRLSVNRLNRMRYEKRTGLTASKKATFIPSHWNLDNLFNPFYVLSNIDCITYTISNKIRNQTYQPRPCLMRSITKEAGGERHISVFTIPDSVVAKYLYKVLLKRNFVNFSSYAFAYRTDRNAHNAIEHLCSIIKNSPRAYIVEYDFSKYFDTISHEYLIETLRNNFKISRRELYLVESLLKYQKAIGDDAYKTKTFILNSVGIPQGSSISLLLANIACMELDKKIESEGVSFARFSDDSVIVCNTYEKAHNCANHLISYEKVCGTKINFLKSDGISLLTSDENAEIRTKKCFDFLGHQIYHDKISIKAKTIIRIKVRLSQIIHRNLILYPNRYGFSSSRYTKRGSIDWDLVTCINEIRRYIYGKISEEQISNCLSDKTERLYFTKCLMSFYPLVSDDQAFKSLDGWLADTLYKALGIREGILVPTYLIKYKKPTKELLLTGKWYRGKIRLETKLPSFFKSWLYTRKLTKVYGIQKFPNPGYY